MPPNTHFSRLNAVVDSGIVGRLSHSQLRVWLILERHAATEADAGRQIQPGDSFPSHGRIASLAGMSIRSIQRALEDLASLALIQKINRSSPGKCPTYRMMTPPSHDTQTVACSEPSHDTQTVACSPSTDDARMSSEHTTPDEQATKNEVTGDKNDPNRRHPHVVSKGEKGTKGITNISLYGGKAIPPDIADVRQYAVTIGMKIESADHFHDHFTSNGWKVSGRSPMKDWQSALRNWKRNQRQSPMPPTAAKAAREFSESDMALPILGGAP